MTRTKSALYHGCHKVIKDIHVKRMAFKCLTFCFYFVSELRKSAQEISVITKKGVEARNYDGVSNVSNDNSIFIRIIDFFFPNLFLMILILIKG